MSKAATLVAGIIFLIVALGSLYRLLFYFPVDIGGERVGQVATFFVLVISTALALMLLRGGLAKDRV